MIILKDNFNRVHDYLRISLTDKCNLNCLYCNPTGVEGLKFRKDDILSFEELLRIIDVFAGKLGIRKIRFTGGEPLVRKDVLFFFEEVYKLKLKYGFKVGLTTNGTILEDKLEKLKYSGLDKLNISLDSLQPERFKYITGKDQINKVLNAIDKAEKHNFSSLKINVVIIKKINDDEIFDFVEFAKNRKITVRFIEFMPFGNNEWSRGGFVGYLEMKKLIEEKYSLHEISYDGNNVSKDYAIEGFKGNIGFVSSISDHFCSTCNRLRINAKGKMKLCLFSSGQNELDLKHLINSGIDDNSICREVENILKFKLEYHPDVEELIKLEENKMLSIGG